MDNNYYETSILDESLEKINKKELLNENIESYKNKLLSSYWMEINLIGYKIELLEKQKVDYTKELENRFIYIGNKIRRIIERNKLNCFNCRVTQTKHWYKYLKEHYLCQPCHDFKIYNGKMRTERITPDRKCYTCEATKTSNWYRHSIPEQYICKSCYDKQQKMTKVNKKASRKGID
uniref:GATA-type domain-containing protein n=1 Tax=Meloidogyne enterolobii TaxID=390850 RepID=A0A6V7WJ28_MELEN|nr:unnamed protein product [Meloidogyne enterolobii]